MPFPGRLSGTGGDRHRGRWRLGAADEIEEGGVGKWWVSAGGHLLAPGQAACSVQPTVATEAASGAVLAEPASTGTGLGAPGDLAVVQERLERATASQVIEWAVGRFGRGLVLACSFQDCVVVDLAVRADPGIEVLFLDTGAHFPETLAYVEAVRSRYDLNLRIVRPGRDAEASPCGTERCCEVRKVAPLARALSGKAAWLTGLRRADAPTRAGAAVVAWDAPRGVVKVNPIAAWTDADVDRYSRAHHLLEHPLRARGYRSIGCAPATRPVGAGEDARAGRWPGTERTECGLHR